MKYAFILTAALAFTPTAAPADADSPFVGTWKYNTTKSHVSSGATPPGESTVTVERDKGGLRWSNEASGTPTKFSYRFQFDGKDYPVTGSPQYDTMSVRQIDPYNWETTSKKNGKVYSTTKRTVSKDGKTMTVVSTRPSRAGETIVWTQVFDRQ